MRFLKIQPSGSSITRDSGMPYLKHMSISIKGEATTSWEKWRSSDRFPFLGGDLGGKTRHEICTPEHKILVYNY